MSANIDAIGQVIRALYVAARRQHDYVLNGTPSTWGERHMPRWDGGRDGRGASHSSVWNRAARLFAARGVDPEAAVHSAFDYREDLDPPQPDALLSDATIQRSFEYADRVENSLRIRFESEQTRIVCKFVELRAVTTKLGWSDEQVWLAVINMSAHELTPLVRYCLAVEKGCHAIAEKYYRLALLQYLRRRRQYDKVMGAYLPRVLVDGADEYLRAAVRQGV